MEVQKFVEVASRYGAAYPGHVMLDPPSMLASLVAMLNLIRSRGVRLMQPPKGFRGVEEPVVGFATVVPTVFKHSDLAKEAVWTAERLNTWAIYLAAFAVNSSKDEKTAREQYLAWWGQLAAALYDTAMESIPDSLRDQLPTIIQNTVRELELAATTPMYLVGQGQLTPGAASGGGPAGGGSPGGGGGGGGSWSDRAMSGAAKGASIGAIGGPTTAVWGAAIGGAAGALGIQNTEDAQRAINDIQNWMSAKGEVPSGQRPTQTGFIGGEAVPQLPSK